MDRNSNNQKQHHEDDLVIVLNRKGREFKATSNKDNKLIYFDGVENKIPQSVIKNSLKENIDNLQIDPKKIKRIKIFDVQHAFIDAGKTIYKNDKCIELLQAVNQLCPNAERTKIYSTVCHSEVVDLFGQDIRVLLFNAVNDKQWSNKHEVDLYLAPFNEQNTFVDNDKQELNGRYKLKINYGHNNDKFLNIDLNVDTQDNPPPTFMNEQQIYKYKKEKNEAKCEYFTRPFCQLFYDKRYDLEKGKPFDVEAPGQWPKRLRKTCVSQHKSTFNSVGDMRNFFEKYHNECQEQLKEFAERRGTDVEKLCQLPENAEYPTYNREQIRQSDGKYYVYQRLEDPNCYLPRRIEQPSYCGFFCKIGKDIHDFAFGTRFAKKQNRTQNNLNTGCDTIKK